MSVSYLCSASKLTLTELVINSCGLIGSNPQFFGQINVLTQLTTISLSNCACLSDASLVSILPERRKRLHHLDLGGCPLLTDVGIIQVTKTCRYLKALVLGGQPGITDEAISAIAKSCGKLNKLHAVELMRLTNRR